MPRHGETGCVVVCCQPVEKARMALTCCRGTLFECSTISFVLVLSIADFAGLGSAACVTQATKFSKNMSESHVQILVALGKAIQRHPRRAATNEDHIAPGNRWCRLCDKGPKWCCACECPECGLPPLKCHCGAIDPYDVYPIRASWDNDWHTTGYHRDFRNGVRALVLKARAAIGETQSSTLAQRKPAPSITFSFATRSWRRVLA